MNWCVNGYALNFEKASSLVIDFEIGWSYDLAIGYAVGYVIGYASDIVFVNDISVCIGYAICYGAG